MVRHEKKMWPVAMPEDLPMIAAYLGSQSQVSTILQQIDAALFCFSFLSASKSRLQSLGAVRVRRVYGGVQEGQTVVVLLVNRNLPSGCVFDGTLFGVKSATPEPDLDPQSGQSFGFSQVRTLQSHAKLSGPCCRKHLPRKKKYPPWKVGGQKKRNTHLNDVHQRVPNKKISLVHLARCPPYPWL